MRIFCNEQKEERGGEVREGEYDWNGLPQVDREEVDRWFGATDAKDRQFPLQVALQVHDELEHALMKPGQMDAMRMSEIRGGMMALSRFARVYAGIIEGRRKTEHA